MEQTARSPKIRQLSWGRIQVEGKNAAYKDARVFPGGSREWDWRETGAKHIPGIQPADVEELLEHGSTVVVLSKGMYERLQVCPETLTTLEDRGVAVHVLQTEAAVQLYNDLQEKEHVGGLFHTTC